MTRWRSFEVSNFGGFGRCLGRSSPGYKWYFGCVSVVYLHKHIKTFFHVSCDLYVLYGDLHALKAQRDLFYL